MVLQRATCSFWRTIPSTGAPEPLLRNPGRWLSGGAHGVSQRGPLLPCLTGCPVDSDGVGVTGANKLRTARYCGKLETPVAGAAVQESH